jgi:hypothetical protein
LGETPGAQQLAVAVMRLGAREGIDRLAQLGLAGGRAVPCRYVTICLQWHRQVQACTGEHAVNKLRLKVKEIDAALSDRTAPPATPDESADDRNVWRDSSIELMRGLDVVELSDDELVIDAQEPPTAPLRGR